MRPRCILKEGIVQWAQECQLVMTVSTHDQRGTRETNGQLTNTGDKEWEGPKERQSQMQKTETPNCLSFWRAGKESVHALGRRGKKGLFSPYKPAGAQVFKQWGATAGGCPPTEAGSGSWLTDRGWSSSCHEETSTFLYTYRSPLKMRLVCILTGTGKSVTMLVSEGTRSHIFTY